MNPQPRKCACKLCYPVCGFEISWRATWMICKQCARGKHKKKVE